MAIIGDFENIENKALKDFIYESNKTNNICKDFRGSNKNI
jgi:hypothetical protein